MAWRKNDPSMGNDPTYLEPRISAAEHKISAIEMELPNKVDGSEKGVANGLATLNSEGKVVDANGNEVEGKVKSVNGQTGDVEFSIPTKTSELMNDSGYTSFSGDYTDLSNKPTIPSTAEQITIADTSNLFLATDVEGALGELFTNVSNGKNLIATAVTDKGIIANDSDTFPMLANKISQISGGKKWASGEISLSNRYQITVNGLGFTPNTVLAYSGSGVSFNTFAHKVSESQSFGTFRRNLAYGFYSPEFNIDGFRIDVSNSGVSAVYTWIAFE